MKASGQIHARIIIIIIIKYLVIINKHLGAGIAQSV
jgi:hypothetical protein